MCGLLMHQELSHQAAYCPQLSSTNSRISFKHSSAAMSRLKVFQPRRIETARLNLPFSVNSILEICDSKECGIPSGVRITATKYSDPRCHRIKMSSHQLN